MASLLAEMEPPVTSIDKCPLFNAIACSVSNPSMVLDVFDCSQHAAEGGKKDAEIW
jgi:hypothetical protein